MKFKSELMKVANLSLNMKGAIEIESDNPEVRKFEYHDMIKKKVTKITVLAKYVEGNMIRVPVLESKNPNNINVEQYDFDIIYKPMDII